MHVITTRQPAAVELAHRRIPCGQKLQISWTNLIYSSLSTYFLFLNVDSHRLCRLEAGPESSLQGSTATRLWR